MPKFAIRYDITGQMTETIEADSLAAAEAIVNAKIEDDNWFPDLDNVDWVDTNIQEMFHVRRKDGSTCFTTNVRPEDKRLP